MGLHDLAANIESSDRWASLCGLLPDGLRTLLLPSPSFGFVVADTRSIKDTVVPLVRELQFTILSCATDVLREWVPYTKPCPHNLVLSTHG